MAQQGIYGKYIVTRTDGRSQPGQKHSQCRYFVLDLDHDGFSVPALRAYAKACKKEYPELAKNLLAFCIYKDKKNRNPNAFAAPPKWMIKMPVQKNAPKAEITFWCPACNRKGCNLCSDSGVVPEKVYDAYMALEYEIKKRK
jgi:hypothetical protein